MTKNDEPHDEIIEELHEIRDGLSARYGHDVDRLYEKVKRMEQVSDREKVTASPKRVQPVS